MTALTERVLDLACAVQQIPAPTFHEQRRAEFVQDRFRAAGLEEVETDDLGNVFGRRPGGSANPLVISAHTDTVFPAETSLALVRAPDRIAGPGIGDNSLGVAALLGWVWAAEAEALPGDVWLAANVCEEGLGDLRGMRRVVERFGAAARAFIVLEGMSLGHIYHAGIAVRRYRVTARAEGGHSWLNFGRPSAIHALVRLAAQITALPIAAAPKTSLNIGTFNGGTSVNAIAREAAFDLDLRSVEPEQLAVLAERVERLASEARQAGVQLEAEVIGQRPAGAIPQDHPLVQAAVRAHLAAGVEISSFEPGSTDANLPLSLGLPCVCLGLTTGGNSHRPDEYIETAGVERGLTVLAQVVRETFDLK
jgi:acetylornithine deacetylase/succinyl-diaminopimelate desuccinylase-like protein